MEGRTAVPCILEALVKQFNKLSVLPARSDLLTPVSLVCIGIFAGLL